MLQWKEVTSISCGKFYSWYKREGEEWRVVDEGKNCSARFSNLRNSFVVVLRYYSNAILLSIKNINFLLHPFVSSSSSRGEEKCETTVNSFVTKQLYPVVHFSCVILKWDFYANSFPAIKFQLVKSRFLESGPTLCHLKIWSIKIKARFFRMCDANRLKDFSDDNDLLYSNPTTLHSLGEQFLPFSI